MKALTAALAAAAILSGCGGSSSNSTSSSPVTTAASTSPASSAQGSQPATSTTAPPAGPGAVTLTHSLRLRSPAFRFNGRIPARYTCDGGDVPLPLQWSGVPAGTRELLLVMRDPDAPTADFVHWAVARIPPSATTIGQGASPPAGAVEGRNSFGTVGYRGPCPPAGGRPHHYVLTLSALSRPSGVGTGFNPDNVHVRALAIATLIGLYDRH